jgi:hypothetical protein
MSGDFSHYVFASTELTGGGFPPVHYPGIPFAAGAETTGVGSAYDNDVASRTVTIVSTLPNGEPIPTDPAGVQRSVDFPGLSPNGSHILMQTNGAGHLKHLYMRVNDALTYEIANGIGVEPIGMTRDGSQVLFSTTASLSPLDTDTSADIYRWEENSGENTLLTGGPTPGPGNPGYTDSCSPTWEGAGCDVKPLTPERAHPNANMGVSVPTAQDDLFAEDSGDVYFYSPESLDPTSPGIANERNLYVYRDGKVQLVGILDAGTEILRMQISPDGSHAAMVTKSRMTSYDNRGYAEMYTYDPDTGALECTSCNPSGAPPRADVMASQGGRFMADDGRAFFATTDPLVPRDQNGKIIDVYEYVGGRPQLITSGLGSRDSTGGAKTVSLFIGAQRTGLEAVSHSGTDVYFSTFESLVSSDHNGEFVKFYDARSNGGFDESPSIGLCAAADECHGEDSSPPTPTVVSTDQRTVGGNLPSSARKKKHHKRSHHRKPARRRGRHHHG